MKLQIKEKFPAWCHEQGVYDLCLSNDLDSLISCKLLEEVKGHKINYFYDFSGMYRAEDTNNNAIAIDVDLFKGKCWGNHVTMLSEGDLVNEESANLNNILKIARDNYEQKYAMSTILQIMSFYDVPLPKSQKARMVLLAIDGSYKGYYYDDFKETYISYLQILEFEELLNTLEQASIEEFYNIINIYNIHKKIYINEYGLLDTNIFIDEIGDLLEIDLMLPYVPFEKIKNFKNMQVRLDYSGIYSKKKVKNIFSCALVRKNYFKYSLYSNYNT